MPSEVFITSDWLKPSAMRELLADELATEEPRVELIERRTSSDYLVDPIVLVAVVGGSSAAISAIVSGLLRILEARLGPRTGRISIEGREGGKVTVPAGTPLAQVEQLIRLQRDMDIERIHIGHG